jgi:mono/diheme cytochrome c family protein
MSARVVGLAPVMALVLASAAFAVEAPDGSFQSYTRFMEKDGESIFAHTCAGCHMPNAQGAIGAARYPALAGNAKLATAAYPVFMVVNGRAGMPSFAPYLDDDQIAGVVNYVRTHFGNDYKDTVSPADVKAVRP